jgi:hypothetical protein
MNRRCFILKAGAFVAGSSLVSSIFGCGVEFLIPCLGPAAAPAKLPGMTYIRASEIGCALDCNLENGHNKHTGGTATDDGPRINAAMAAATAENPITLIIDGSALISGLFLPAGGHWSIAGLGCGTGFFVKRGTNNDGIRSGFPYQTIPTDPGPPAPPRGANVSLSNFTLNGNQGDGTNGDSTSGIHQGASETLWYFGINLMNLDHISFEKVVVVNTPSYHVRFSNVGHVTVSGCVFKSFGASTDGLHFDGPANDIAISGCDFTTNDDGIALNCPEGYSGNISRVAVTNCTFNSWSMMRLYTTTGSSRKFSIESVSVSQCSGTLTEAAFLIGVSGGSSPNSIASLTISDCDLTAPTILGMAENFGTNALKNVTFVPFRSDAQFIPPQSTNACSFVRTSPLYGGIAYVGSSLSFENCTINRKSDVEVSALLLENDPTIDTLTFNGFVVQDSGSYSPIPVLLDIGSGGSIKQLVLRSIDSGNIKSLVSTGESASIGSITGPAALANGW